MKIFEFGFIEDDERKSGYREAVRAVNKVNNILSDVLKELSETLVQKAVLLSELEQAHWRIEELEYDLEQAEREAAKRGDDNE